MTVNISAIFTKKQREHNGLNDIAKDLLAEPLERRYAVVMFEAKFAKKDYADGTETPTVKFVHIEPLTDDAADDAKELLLAAYRKRTNRDEDAPVDPTLFDSDEG